MTLQRQWLVWCSVGITLILLLWLLKSILLPFVAGLAVAYFLDPSADWLEEKGLSRMAATSIISIGFTILAIVLLLVLGPLIYDQAVRLLESLPDVIDQVRSLVAQFSEGRLGKLLAENGDLKNAAGDVAKSMVNWLLKLFGSVLDTGLAIAGLISLIVVTPIVAFYMLLDWDRMVARINALLPLDHAGNIRNIAREIDDVLAGFVRGQGLVCVLLGSFYAIGLTLAGLQFGLLIGLMAGLISFIPYVGSIVGVIVAGGVALAQFWPDYTQIGIVLAVFVIGQAIEGNFLTPKLVGNKVRLHPVWIMFALFAFGALFGFVGMLLAVPISAAIGVIARFGVSQYEKSHLFAGVTGFVSQGVSDDADHDNDDKDVPTQ